MDPTRGGHMVLVSEEARDTDSLMMEEKPDAAVDAPETRIIGGK